VIHAVPLIAITIAIPALLALVAGLRRSSNNRALAVGGALAAGAGALAVAIAFATSRQPSLDDPWMLHESPVLGVDALSVALLVACALLFLVVALVARPRELSPASLASLFATEALVFATFSAVHVVPLVVVWSAVGVPAWLLARHQRLPRSITFPAGLFLVGFAMPAAVAAIVHGGAAAPHGALLAAILIGVLSRMGLVPFHSWLAPMVAEAPTTAALPLIASCTGPYLLARFAAPIATWWPSGAFAFLGALAVVAAVYAALLAFGERRLRYVVAYIVMSESALVFAGLCTGDHETMRGAMVFSISEGFAAVGLLVATRALEVRVGPIDISTYHGLYRSTPRLATLHLIFALAAIGFPGFASYIGEDLLIEGETHRQLAMGIAFAGVAALNGVTAFRAFSRTFLGPADKREHAIAIPDLVPRKRFVFFAILAVQVAFGILPMTLLRRLPTFATDEAAAGATSPPAERGLPWRSRPW
jgi:NADH-quinone oxidoreductase subunit M